ncbi:MAG TPA: SDR family NAD(P)-dependent oxidoreductase [Steroidobacteraceae bacterium]|nr:SDR family NAD(P)-dependent oxidoreductase [Steroidobacteraceae bacterium]
MRNVIVTGASRGLGLAIASALASRGYRVIGIARSDTEEFGAAVAALAQQPETGALLLKRFDLAETRSIGALITALRKQYGALYGLVNNAGLGTAGVLSNMRLADIEALTRINLTAPIVLCKYALRSMMSERCGRIVNISSIAAATGHSGLSVYGATKGALIGLTRSLAREVGQLDITVNAIAPGFISTAMTAGLDAPMREKIAHRSALRRLADAADVAAAVQFLLSDEARNITGTTLTVDAGATA